MRDFLLQTQQLGHAMVAIDCLASFKMVNEKNVDATTLVANCCVFDQFEGGLSTQLTANMTQKCNGGSKFSLFLYTDVKSFFYLA